MAKQVQAEKSRTTLSYTVCFWRVIADGVCSRSRLGGPTDDRILQICKMTEICPAFLRLDLRCDRLPTANVMGNLSGFTDMSIWWLFAPGLHDERAFVEPTHHRDSCESPAFHFVIQEPTLTSNFAPRPRRESFKFARGTQKATTEGNSDR